MKKQKISAGILLYTTKPLLQVMLVHPGGPFWKKKDDGVWSIPKGEIDENEDAFSAALRELKEETGITFSSLPVIELAAVKQKSGKIIKAWAIEYFTDVNAIISNTFEIEWPPKSGKLQTFPEVDKAQWFTVEEARIKINEAQFALIEELQQKIL